MTALSILDEIVRRGAKAQVLDDGRLRVAPASVLDATLLDELRAHKAEVIATIRRGELSTTPDHVARFGPPSRGSKICERCRRLGTCFWVRGAIRVCGDCVRPDDERLTPVEAERRDFCQRTLGPLADVRLTQFRRPQPHDDGCDCSTLTEHFERGGSYDHWLEAKPDDRGAESLSLDAIMEHLQTLWNQRGESA